MTINRSTMMNHRNILVGYRLAELVCVLISVLISTLFKSDAGITLVRRLPGISFEHP